MASEIFATIVEFTDILDLSDPSGPKKRSAAEWISKMCDSWFSRKHKTKEMMQGTRKEAMAMGFLNDVPCFAAVYHVGLLMSLDTNCVACSPDEVEILEIDSITGEMGWGEYMHIKFEDSPFSLSTVEIKTLVLDT